MYGQGREEDEKRASERERQRERAVLLRLYVGHMCICMHSYIHARVVERNRGLSEVLLLVYEGRVCKYMSLYMRQYMRLERVSVAPV